MAKLSLDKDNSRRNPCIPRHEVPHPFSKDPNVGGRSMLASRADKVGSSFPTAAG